MGGGNDLTRYWKSKLKGNNRAVAVIGLIFQLVKQLDVETSYKNYIPELTRKGSRWVARCPFHAPDRSPSFTVFTDGGWKCFGCGASGGDLTALVAKIYGLKPVNAAKVILQDFGIDVNGTTPLPIKAIRNMNQAAREREAKKLFEKKVNCGLDYLQPLVRSINAALNHGGYNAYIENEQLVHQLLVWEHLVECLLDDDPEVQMMALMAPGVREWLEET